MSAPRTCQIVDVIRVDTKGNYRLATMWDEKLYPAWFGPDEIEIIEDAEIALKPKEKQPMYEHMDIPGEVSRDDLESLAQQLREITLPDGRKPFTVMIDERHAIHYEILLMNEVGTAVLMFRKG